jgi:hypothetical protein
MPTFLRQLERHASGSAAFEIRGPATRTLTDPEELTIAIVQPGPTELYLDPRNPEDPWTTSIYWFHPREPHRQGNELWLDIDYGVTFHLRANNPYKLRMRQAGGAEVEEIFTVPATLRRPSTRPKGWTPPPHPKGPVELPPQTIELAAPPPALAPQAAPPGPSVVPQPPSAPSPLPPAAPPAAAAASPPALPPAAAAPPPPPRRLPWLVLVLLLLIVTGALGYYWKTQQPPAAMRRAGPAEIADMDACRKAVVAQPAASAARADADALGNKGRLLQCQFLLYKYAAEKGDRDAARHMGIFYDPDTWSKDKSPLPEPNATEAARWHKQAAEAGDVESQYRYGMLLKLGRTEVADAPAQAQAWLKKAADAGNERARQELAP